MKFVIIALFIVQQQLSRTTTIAFQQRSPFHHKTDDLYFEQLKFLEECKTVDMPPPLLKQRIKTKQYAFNYFNKEDMKYNSSSDSSVFTKKTTKLSAAVAVSSFHSNPPFRIFCDMDGVLCDFDAGVRLLSKGRSADSLPADLKWNLIAKADRFFERLPWTRDGRRLWSAIRPHCPTILTGVSDDEKCPIEKAKWCARELGVDTNHVDKASRSGTKYNHDVVKGKPKDDKVNIITCWSTNKHHESGERAVLIDDRETLAENWIAKGGIFIHHTDTERTLEQLRQHGILPSDEETPEIDILMP